MSGQNLNDLSPLTQRPFLQSDRASGPRHHRDSRLLQHHGLPLAGHRCQRGKQPAAVPAERGLARHQANSHLQLAAQLQQLQIRGRRFCQVPRLLRHTAPLSGNLGKFLSHTLFLYPFSYPHTTDNRTIKDKHPKIQ